MSSLHYAAVGDAGTIVNPKTLNGQIIGGTVQGLGTALYEEYPYDDQGRVRNETFEYYHLSSSMDVPPMTIAHQETPVSVHDVRHQGRRRAWPNATSYVDAASRSCAKSHGQHLVKRERESALEGSESPETERRGGVGVDQFATGLGSRAATMLPAASALA